MKWIIKKYDNFYVESNCRAIVYTTELERAKRFDTEKSAKETFKKWKLQSYCTIEKIES